VAVRVSKDKHATASASAWPTRRRRARPDREAACRHRRRPIRRRILYYYYYYYYNHYIPKFKLRYTIPIFNNMLLNYIFSVVFFSGVYNIIWYKIYVDAVEIILLCCLFHDIKEENTCRQYYNLFSQIPVHGE